MNALQTFFQDLSTDGRAESFESFFNIRYNLQITCRIYFYKTNLSSVNVIVLDFSTLKRRRGTFTQDRYVNIIAKSQS